jgi:hypothetical protein
MHDAAGTVLALVVASNSKHVVIVLLLLLLARRCGPQATLSTASWVEAVTTCTTPRTVSGQDWLAGWGAVPAVQSRLWGSQGNSSGLRQQFTCTLCQFIMYYFCSVVLLRAGGHTLKHSGGCRTLLCAHFCCSAFSHALLCSPVCHAPPPPSLSYPLPPASIKIMYEPQPTPRAVEGLLGVTVKQVKRE